MQSELNAGFSEMNGNGYMEVHYVNSDGNFPYTGTESFVNFFEDHTHMPMNCVPAAPMHHQVQLSMVFCLGSVLDLYLKVNERDVYIC